jgi:hypothetical protein
MNWKGCGRNGSQPNLKELSHHLHGGMEKTCPDSWSLGRDLKAEPLKYEAGVSSN